MQDGDLNQLKSKNDFVSFSDQEAYGLTVSGCDFSRCTFRNVGLKNTTFENGNLKHSRFVDAYLNGATFRRIDLAGTRFERCDLRHASFDGCKLWYVEFSHCHLEFDTIRNCLPPEVNLKRKLLRSLRLNANEMGDAAGARKMLEMELAEERKELFQIFVGSDDYFRQRYKGGKRVSALFDWLGHNCQRFAWGYGLRLTNLFCAGLLVVLIFASIIWHCEVEFMVSSSKTSLSLFESVYVSAVTFSTLGSPNHLPLSTASRMTSVAESLCGCVFLGLLAAATYRRIRP